MCYLSNHPSAIIMLGRPGCANQEVVHLYPGEGDCSRRTRIWPRDEESPKLAPFTG